MRRLFLFIAIACALPFSAAAQQAPGTPEPPVFGEEVDVRVVNIEVVVTDGSGNRVPDLAPGDFQLRVDGKDVPVEYFTEVREGRSIADAEPAAESVEGKPEVQSVAPEGAVGTYYLVFIDDFFAITPRRNDVLKALKADLGRLRPEDRMAIVAYDGGRLAMISNWSGSQSDLQRAFDQAMARTARGFDRIAERRSFLGDEAFIRTATDNGDGLGNPGGAVTTPGVTGGHLKDEQLAYAGTLVRQMQGVVGATVSAMRGFAAPQGRKVMLLLSGGWPFSVESYVLGAAPLTPSREIKDGEDLFLPLTSTANLLGYTLYPVDVPGTQPVAAADVEATAPSQSGFGLGNLAEQEVEGSLHFLAEETGGKPMLNSNRTAALANVSADTRSYYWLGFSPTWQHNDKRHDIKVEVRRPGLKVRSRDTFLDLSRKAEVSMKVESALLFGSFPGALPMPMRLGAPVRTKRGQFEIPVTLGLPADIITAVPLDGKYAAKLELRFAASDEKGNSSEIPVLPLTLASEKPPTPGKFVRYDTKLTFQGKASHVVVAVYDPLSGKVATAEADIVVPK